ncbi:uncharacterized protein LOC123519346 [Portunus trituberculatus]|uniref:uncharacterized protein LOC123519346 n=1 Tax=Portunus trituberculatus TaxID=210409 RepID=UPI001E1CE7BE|nr:uncharacterized protein LOC123519346 [Portunus trituberculatus]
MTVLSYLKRRVFGKSAFVIKRVVVPAAAVFLLMQVLFSGSPAQHDQKAASDLSNLIVPGEAIDPVLQRKTGHHFGNPQPGAAPCTPRRSPQPIMSPSPPPCQPPHPYLTREAGRRSYRKRN